MKKLLTLFILCSTLSFGQYIKKATLVLSDGKKMEVEDVFYGDKVYEYKLKMNKSSNQAIIKEDVSEIIFDSIDFINKVDQNTYTEIKDKYYENDLPEGIYETIDDFYKKIPSSTKKVVGREEGQKYYDNPKDLMAFKYVGSDDILRNTFAVVYKGNLYLSIKASNKNEAKEMKGGFMIDYSKNYFLKVKFANSDYFYSEISAIPSGEAITKMAVGSYYGAPYRLKYILYPFILLNNEQKFYAVKNCKRFNEYFENKLNKRIPCEKDNDFLDDVRKLMILQE